MTPWRFLSLLLLALPAAAQAGDASVGGYFRVGTRPANLANPAVTIANGEAVAGADGIAEVAFTSALFQNLFFTIDRSGADAATGDYNLTLDFTP